MLTRPLQAGEREESGELFWSCHASNAVSFRTAPHDPAGLSPMPDGSPSPGSWLSTPAAASRRRRRVQAFSQRLDLRALGYELVAFMSLWVSQTDPAILAGLLAVPEVVAVRSTTLDVSILTQVVAKNIRDRHRITGSIRAVDGVARSSTAISLDEVIPSWPHAPLRVARRLLAQTRTIPARTAGALS